MMSDVGCKPDRIRRQLDLDLDFGNKYCSGVLNYSLELRP